MPQNFERLADQKTDLGQTVQKLVHVVGLVVFQAKSYDFDLIAGQMFA